MSGAASGPPDVAIRPAQVADLGAVQAIYALEVTEGTASFELEPPDRAEIARRFQAVTGQGWPYLVAERNDRILGYAYVGPYRPRPAYRFTVEDSVYIAREARRLGIGRRLLDALIERTVAAGGRQMVAIIGDSAHIASVRLHERAGFRLVGTLENVGFKFDRWLDTVIMQRPLGDALGAWGATTGGWQDEAGEGARGAG